MQISAPMPGKKMKVKPRKPAPKGGRFVHLGSYKNSRTLEKGWRSIRKRYAGVLGKSPRSVSKVWLDKKKGQYLRLGVSVASLKAAQSICR